MKKIKADICPFNHFPDHMILQIFNKLFDLKTLCICKLVSKRFNWIIRQVDTVSFTVTRPDNDTLLFCKSFFSVVNSMCKFTSIKSISIDFPSMRYDEYIETRCLFKFGKNRFRSFLVVSPNAIYDKNGISLLSFRNGNQEEDNLLKKVEISIDCFVDTFIRYVMFSHCIIVFPSLEKISISDSSKKRMFSVCGGKFGQVVREWLDSSSSETIEQRGFYCIDKPSKVSRCFIPSLKLPVSGYVMKGVSAVFCQWGDLLDGDDADDYSLMNGFEDDDAEDKQKADAYRETMTEIFKNYM